jgi:hypothetical protein
MDKITIAVHLKRRAMLVGVEDGSTHSSRMLRTISPIIGGGPHLVKGILKLFKTPIGKFKIHQLDRYHMSHKYHAPMPFSVFFTDDGDAFHQGDVHKHSHGCVHLSPADAQWLYNLMQENKDNTDVEISDD